MHGDLEALRVLAAKLPPLSEEDTIVFLGDYLDRGPCSRQVVELVRRLDQDKHCRVECLIGNHEDAWLKVIDEGWPGFLLPPANGCLATLRSYTGGPVPKKGEMPRGDELGILERGGFLPDDHVAWMRSLPHWYEDEHAIYVHAGLVDRDGAFLHPSELDDPRPMLWTRSDRFFREYDAKRVVVGHTMTELLPPELSTHTPADPTDLWAGPGVVALDTGAGKGGFLTCVELPAMRVYESR
ncbi:MAG: metallophosphoesterase [Acidobacteria bacterium]|nr:metallophosphoesterase [Acidobacteriota bacterium]MCB9594556.1 metallophosphoesterase [Sandaracinaceae bacterium]